jgi:enoyl-CoA hydratase/carnithine racemase
MPVTITRAEGVTTVEFAGDTSMNLLDSAAIAELTARIEEVAADPGTRVVILRGTGERAFIGGADIKEMATLDHQTGEDFIRGLAGLCDAIRSCPVPVIARLAGWCLGGGLEVAMACDLRVAVDSARFGMPEITIGIPSVIHAALMPALIGASRAAWLQLTGEIISASTAEEWGLVHKVISANDLDTSVSELGTRLAGFGPAAVREQKRLLNRWFDLTATDAIADSVPRFAGSFLTGEPRHYMTAFLNRRPRKSAD